MAQAFDSHGDYGGTATAAPAEPAPPPPRYSQRSGYSRFVSVLKVLLPATAVGLIILVIAWQKIGPTEGIIPTTVPEWQGAGEVSVLNPRWNGVDEENRPFTVTADLVSQSTGDGNLYELELPKADITLEDDTWLALTAKSGRFFYEEQQLELIGDVDLFHDQGFEIRTEAATIDLKTKDAQGDSPVEGHGPAGRLNAEGFRITQEGARITFTGKSRLIVYPEAQEAIR
ncbi:LPS export ABC transporter periplasmic protein LptC [Pelagibius sp. Alg239-R121]|uniref:LPS export ABC transporter periplasmic protein LptC n=1 Tax=Pelagibius sp. Alg239-R121 TaxID=2993448 RepID=UPI0024A74937|nr:LPS export ABC transporter periplasmic protein LptC [Pelagibius sp. Alg239-R121]